MTKVGMVEIRCPNCNTLLCVTNGDIEIKCRKCKALIKYDAKMGKILRDGIHDKYKKLFY